MGNWTAGPCRRDVLNAFLAFVAIAIAFGPFASEAMGAGPGEGQAGPMADAKLSDPARATIAQALGRRDQTMHADVSRAGVRLANRSHGIRARFGRRGATIRASEADFTLGLRAVGREGEMHGATARRPRARHNRVTYHRGNGVREWYVNGPLGLEHGFTVDRRPAPDGGPLTLALAVGGARAEVDGERKNATFSTDGRTVATYRGLWAHDAAGRPLRAWLVGGKERLLLRVADAGARYPLTIDPYVQAAKLTASDGMANDNLGFSVAASGDTVVVGAPTHDVEGSSSQGAAYVFQKPAEGWSGPLTEVGKLVASDGVEEDEFGNSIGVSGETVVVGSPGWNSNRGAAYVFTLPGGAWSGTLTETAKLTALGGEAEDGLGGTKDSIAVSGDTVVAGASNATVGGNTFQGKAYVFVKPTAGWSDATESATLTASDGETQDGLGWALAVSGETVVAGVPGRATDGNTLQGAAYVFTEPPGGWAGSLQEQALLTASDGSANDEFGYAVSVDGDTVVAGAPLAEIGGNAGQGAGYVYVQPGGGWSNTTETAKLTAAGSPAGAGLGIAIAISGERVLGGAPGVDSGVAYVFERPSGGWGGAIDPPAELVPEDGGPEDEFGTDVAASAEALVAGSSGNDSNRGAAYVFGQSAVPTTTVGLAPPDPNGDNGWYTSSVHVTVDATPPEGGAVDETRCVLDPAVAPSAFNDIPAGCPYLGTGADVGADGRHTVYAASTDTAGDAEAPVSATFKIDATGPSLTCESAPTFSRGATGAVVTASVADAGSGPAAGTASAPADTDSVGERAVTLSGRDLAGNSTAVDCPYEVEGAQDSSPPAPNPPAPGPENGTPPRPGGKLRLSLAAKRDLVVRRGTVGVGCRATRGRLRACGVQARLRHRMRGAPAGTVIAKGVVRRRRAARSLRPRLRLTRAGRRLVASALGGVPVRLTATARGTRGRARARRPDRLFARFQHVAPRGSMFGPYSAVLLAPAKRYLRKVRARARKVTMVRCTGHTASVFDTGNTPFTENLGRARARAACDYLRALGLRARYRTASRGKADPRSTNSTRAGQARNRYVELTIHH